MTEERIEALIGKEAVIRSWAPSGWGPLIQKLHEDLTEIDPDYRLDQVKEKFGTLRYYVGHQHTERCVPIVSSIDCSFYQLIVKAEQASHKICQECGKPGSLRKHGWWRTLCDSCDMVNVTGLQRW